MGGRGDDSGVAVEGEGRGYERVATVGAFLRPIPTRTGRDRRGKSAKEKHS